MDDVPTPQTPGWSDPSGVTHLSLSPSPGTGALDLMAALIWAEQRNAVLRFNNNAKDGEHSVRVTALAHHPGNLITAVHQVPDDVPFTDVLTRAVAEVREHWEATDPRHRLRLVASDEDGWDQLYDNQPAGWEQDRREPPR